MLIGKFSGAIARALPLFSGNDMEVRPQIALSPGNETSDLSRIARTVVAGAYVTVIAALAVFLLRYAFNFPYREDFILADYYWRHFFSGTLSFREALLAHNVVHPIGAEAALTLAMFGTFGVNFNLLVYANALLLLIAQALIYLAARPFLDAPTAGLAALSLLVIGLHPSQTNHLLWPFEIGWFMITAALALNCWLIEKLRSSWLAACLAALSCLVGAMSSAHGMVLWAAVTLHLLLRQRPRWWSIAFLAAFAANVIVIARLTPSDEARLTFTDLPNVVPYVVRLIGGTAFTVRAESLTLIFGAAFVIAALCLCLIHLRQRFATPTARVGLVMIFAGALMVAAFCIGRYPYGLVWAFGYFHLAPQLLPFLMGTALMALALLDAGEKRWLAAPALLIVIASVGSAIPYALERGRDSLTERATAMHYTCMPDTSLYLKLNLNGFRPEHADLVRRTMPALAHLCELPLPLRAQLLTVMPALFQQMIASDPKAAEPLRDLWETYVASYFLIHAFWIGEPGAAKLLLEFAHNNALQGSFNYSEKLKRHEVFFASLKLD